MGATRVKAGDILLNVTGASIGRTCLVPTPFVSANVNQHVCIIRIPEGDYRTFVALVLKSDVVKGQISLGQNGAARDGLNFDQIGNLTFAIPLDTTVAQSIVAFVDRETGRLDALHAEANNAIDLLQERRTALIAAVVTGKIDVRGEVAKPVEVQKPYAAGFARQLLAAEILHRCYSQPTLGRVKLQKLIYLCEHDAQIEEVHGGYLREAAGPFDHTVMFGIAAGLKKQKWFTEVKGGGRAVYQPLEKVGEHKKYLARWANKMPKIDHILQLLGTATSQQCEIVATLYAAWNDLLIENKAPTDAEIIHEATSGWHASKEKIPAEKWPAALGWMRKNKLLPVGYGSHTKSASVSAKPKTVRSRKRQHELAQGNQL